jgi:hypothetical protein
VAQPATARPAPQASGQAAPSAVGVHQTTPAHRPSHAAPRPKGGLFSRFRAWMNGE